MLSGLKHVIQLPAFQFLRVYHAHSASVTSISISPYPPPLPTLKLEIAPKLPVQVDSPLRPSSRQSGVSPAPAAKRAREPSAVPPIASNNIYIATSSMDGNICVQSLLDVKDVQLRNFARPIQAVALSPEYKNDRTYLSGGLAGQLILTVGGQPGRSTSTTTGTAVATATGWLNTIGIGNNAGRDTILHSGEGTINSIKWSLSGKYVAWLNEHGIKIMRTRLHLDSSDAEDAWSRIGHIDRPQTEEWNTMASVWKGRAEWIDEQAIETDEVEGTREDFMSTPLADKTKLAASTSNTKVIERLLVGWGGAIWIIHVHPSEIGVGKNIGEKSTARAEIAAL
jgi:vacuolar protein sorting-associated protein 41